MLFLVVVFGTVGIVTIVPSVLRAIDKQPADTMIGFVAFASSAFALTLLVMMQVATSGPADMVASIAIGLAAGVVSPEILSSLRGDRSQQRETPETRPASTDHEPGASV